MIVPARINIIDVIVAEHNAMMRRVMAAPSVVEAMKRAKRKAKREREKCTTGQAETQSQAT